MKYRFPITFEAMFALVMKDPKLCYAEDCWRGYSRTGK